MADRIISMRQELFNALQAKGKATPLAFLVKTVYVLFWFQYAVGISKDNSYAT